MELKEGYKMTDVGVIPEDWEVTKLSNLGRFKKGKGIARAEANSGTLPCVRYGELYTKYNDIIRHAHSGISPEVAKESESTEYGDVLFAGSGETKAEIGKCASYVITEPGYAGGDIVVFTAHRQDPFFLGYALNVPNVQGQKAAMGQGDAVVHIHASHLGRLKLCLPPLREQQAIAEVLSDVDAEIESLARRHDKLVNQKQGLSEELLSGRTRLVEPKSKGFKQTDVGVIPEDWEVYPLGKVCQVIGGGTPSTGIPEYWGNEINWFTPSEVGDIKFLQGSKRKITSQGLSSSGAKLLPKGTILLTTRASIGEVGILTEESTTNQGFQSLVPHDVNAEFLYYLAANLKPEFIERASGSTFLEISPSNVKAVKAVMPSFAEQRAIAEVLSDVDAEIQAVAKLKAKVQAKKEGFMQTLLTGKIRLT